MNKKIEPMEGLPSIKVTKRIEPFRFVDVPDQSVEAQLKQMLRALEVISLQLQALPDTLLSKTPINQKPISLRGIWTGTDQDNV